jgi:hypothetical protein
MSGGRCTLGSLMGSAVQPLDLVLAAGPGSASCMLQVRRGARAVCIHVRKVACARIGWCSRVCEPEPLGQQGAVANACSTVYRCGDRFSPFLQCSAVLVSCVAGHSSWAATSTVWHFRSQFAYKADACKHWRQLLLVLMFICNSLCEQRSTLLLGIDSMHQCSGTLDAARLRVAPRKSLYLTVVNLNRCKQLL